MPVAAVLHRHHALAGKTCSGSRSKATYVFAPHAVVAEVDVAVPESLLAQHPANTTTSG